MTSHRGSPSQVTEAAQPVPASPLDAEDLRARVDRALEIIAKEGHLYEADGATWMRTTDFGDDKDRVLIRSNGEQTYFASDTAYYLDKRARGFEQCLYLLGADHHGYVGRLQAMAACAGDEPGYNLQVLIGQLVKILSDGVELKLSKRAGTLVTLSELIDMVDQVAQVGGLGHDVPAAPRVEGRPQVAVDDGLACPEEAARTAPELEWRDRSIHAWPTTATTRRDARGPWPRVGTTQRW